MTNKFVFEGILAELQTWLNTGTESQQDLLIQSIRSMSDLIAEDMPEIDPEPPIYKTLNRDQATRDKILGFNPEEIAVRDDIQRYSGCTIDTLEKLIAGGFVDLDQTQNDSPTIAQFREFMTKFPESFCHGYVVDKSRSDYRFSIEGIQITKPNVTLQNRLAFIAFCKGADELQTNDDLYAWWD